MIARLSLARFGSWMCGLVAAVGLSLCGTAKAQFGEAAGIAEAMSPEYLSRDIALFNEGLDLDETQRTILRTLFDDYQHSFDTGKDGLKGKFEEMRPQLVGTDESRIMSLIFLPFIEWGKERAKLGEEFIENVKVILTPQQMERWPAFDRRLLREKEMSEGRLSGESTDLLYIIRDMHLDELVLRSAQPVLDQYDLALDQALRARKDYRLKMRTEMLNAMSAQDSQKSLKFFEGQVALQVAVRDVNDQYIESISTALPSDLGQKFRKTALERAYPRVYRETPVERLYTAALELDGLSADMLKAVRELQSKYVDELAAINATLIKSLRGWEPVEAKQRAAAFASRMEGGAPERQEDPTRDDFVKRDELGNRYAKSLQALLTPEQFGLLPGSFRWLAETEKSKPIPTPASERPNSHSLGISPGGGKAPRQVPGATDSKE
jgi:hypothetical protein